MIHKGNGIQVVYGPQVAVIKSNLVDFMESPESDVEQAAPAAPASPAPASTAERSGKEMVVGAHMNGTVVMMSDVPDEAFASGALGEGAAIEPSEGKLYAPADGVVEMVFDTRHAVSLTTVDGVELLLHIGLDTIKLGGKYFEAHVQSGQEVKKGDLLISFDLEAIKAEGYPVTTPMAVCNTDEYASVSPLTSGEAKAGEDLLKIQG